VVDIRLRAGDPAVVKDDDGVGDKDQVSPEVFLPYGALRPRLGAPRRCVRLWLGGDQCGDPTEKRVGFDHLLPPRSIFHQGPFLAAPYRAGSTRMLAAGRTAGHATIQQSGQRPAGCIIVWAAFHARQARSGLGLRGPHHRCPLRQCLATDRAGGRPAESKPTRFHEVRIGRATGVSEPFRKITGVRPWADVMASKRAPTRMSGRRSTSAMTRSPAARWCGTALSSTSLPSGLCGRRTAPDGVPSEPRTTDAAPRLFHD
jgi:hypothetical protein